MTTKPQTIGNFQLLRTLGEGGMGVVFEAQHVTMHRRAAIKVLRPELIKDEQAIRRFFNEARATNEVRHPGIVQIYDCGTREDGSPWLIMELLEGETLTSRMERRGAMPLAEVVTLAAQTTSVLEAAHRAGIIHRDLKPDNLFIVNNQETPTGERIKVLDFGIAKLTSSGGAKSMHTQTGMLMGTPLYMSPEQCRGVGHVDARSDIYSFGLILYQMVCGHLPFVSDGMGELFDMQMNHPPPPLDRKVPGIAPALADLIYRALKKDPGERFQTMAELQRALIAAGEAPRAPATPSAPSGPAVMPVVAATSATAGVPGGGASRGAPISSTTLSAAAMEVEPFEVPHHRLSRPLLIAGAALLLAGGAIFAVKSLGGDGAGAGSDDQAEQPPELATPRPKAPPQPPPPARAAEKKVVEQTPAPATAPAQRPAPAKVPPAATAAPAAATHITVDLKSAPPEARVIDPSDGHLIGVTPLHQVRDRGEGSFQVRVEKPGFVSRTVTIPQRQDYRGTIRLDRAGAAEPREPPASDGEHIIKL